MVPENSPNTATVIASVDDNGFGEGTVTESNELNNIDEAPYELLLPAIITEALDVELCDSGQAVFLDITQQEIDVIGNQSNVEVAYYLTLEDAEASTNAILNPSDFEITESLQTIFYRVFSISDPTCAVTSSFQVSVVEPPVPVGIQDVTSCDFENANSVAFNFSAIQMQIENDNPNAVVSFYISLEDAEQTENAIGLNPTFQTETLPRTVYVNISNPSFENCSVIETFRVTTENCDIDVPTGFSPNGDQTNDTFTIAGLDNFYENYELRIYNRWGTLVYKGNKSTADWDGFSNQPSIGKKSLPVGTYFYWLQLDPEKTDTKVGWVYLTR
jgi:gliding motility-associated-like protein